MDDRWIVILETLDEGYGVSLDILSKDEIKMLIKYAHKRKMRLYLCEMGGNPAIRMDCK